MALLLGFAIVGGGSLFNKEAAAYTLISAPAKSGLTSLSHEIQVCDSAEKPEVRFCGSDCVIGVWPGLEVIIRNSDMHGLFGLRIKNSGQIEVFGEGVIWRGGKLLSEMPTAFDLSEVGLCSTTVSDVQIVGKTTIEVLRNPIRVLLLTRRKMEIGDLRSQNRQFYIDSGSGAEISGVSGEARRASQANSENTEYCREDSNDYCGRRRKIIVPAINQSSGRSPKGDYFTGGAIFLGTLIAFAGFAALLQWQFTRLDRR